MSRSRTYWFFPCIAFYTSLSTMSHPYSSQQAPFFRRLRKKRSDNKAIWHYLTYNYVTFSINFLRIFWDVSFVENIVDKLFILITFVKIDHLKALQQWNRSEKGMKDSIKFSSICGAITTRHNEKFIRALKRRLKFGLFFSFSPSYISVHGWHRVNFLNLTFKTFLSLSLTFICVHNSRHFFSS